MDEIETLQFTISELEGELQEALDRISIMEEAIKEAKYYLNSL